MRLIMFFWEIVRYIFKGRFIAKRFTTCMLLLLVCEVLFVLLPQKKYQFQKRIDKRYLNATLEEKSPKRLVKPTLENISYQKFLCMHFKGGFGNHLWQYTALYALAKQSGRIPVFCADRRLNQIFTRLTIQSEACHESKCINFGAPLKEEWLTMEYHPEVLEKLKNSSDINITLTGFFQNLKYPGTYINDMKREFSLHKKNQVAAQRFLHKIVKTRAKELHVQMTRNNKGQVLLEGQEPIFVTVQVRRGNMLKSWYSYVPNQSYFKNALDYMRRKHGNNTMFVVATNDIEWSKENIKGGDVYFTQKGENKDYKEEFAIALACNHTIMSTGTFGWWMGFLTEGDVVFFKDWPKGESVKKAYIQKERFPRPWIPMVENL